MQPNGQHYDGWRTSATDIPEGTSGRFTLKHWEVQNLPRKHWGLDGINTCLVSGTLTYINEKVPGVAMLTEWMIDDPARQRVMELYAAQAEGRVLVGGIGLGLLQHELAKNPRVTALFTSEISLDVAKLVEVPGTVFVDDFWLTAMTGMHFDTMIADLWDDRAASKLSDLNGLSELYLEVQQRSLAVREANPKAKLILHGFPALSDYDPLKTPSHV